MDDYTNSGQVLDVGLTGLQILPNFLSFCSFLIYSFVIDIGQNFWVEMKITDMGFLSRVVFGCDF